MVENRYLKAIKEGIAEYAELSEQKKALELRMQKVLQLVAANVNMLPDEDQEFFVTQLVELTPPSGLRGAILRVLPNDIPGLSPTEVRDALVGSGYDFTGQANPLASIHTTLRRLIDSGDALAHVPQPDGKTFYRKSGMRQSTEAIETLAEMMRAYPPVTGTRTLSDLAGSTSVSKRTHVISRTRKRLVDQVRESEKDEKPKFYGR